jgi:hypothetical protein
VNNDISTKFDTGETVLSTINVKCVFGNLDKPAISATLVKDHGFSIQNFGISGNGSFYDV